MAGLWDALKQYIGDALPGGALNPETQPIARKANYLSGILDPASQVSQDAQAWHKRTQNGLMDQLAGRQTPAAEQAYQTMMQAAGIAPVGMIAWHGSPHKFDKFDPSMIGTSQDGKLFGGRGFSVADNPADAKMYGENLYKVDIPDAAILDARNKSTFPNAFGDLTPRGESKSLKQMVQEYEAAKKATKIEDVYLEDLGNGFKGIQWKVNGEWKSPVNNRVSSLELSQDPTGMAYALRHELPKDPSEFFNTARFNPDDVSSAVRGRGYGAVTIDGSIGHRGDETTIIDHNLIRILERNGQPTGLQPWKPGEWKR